MSQGVKEWEYNQISSGVLFEFLDFRIFTNNFSMDAKAGTTNAELIVTEVRLQPCNHQRAPNHMNTTEDRKYGTGTGPELCRYNQRSDYRWETGNLRQGTGLVAERRHRDTGKVRSLC